MFELANSRAGHLVRRLHQISQAIFLEETARYGLTSVQYHTLNAIFEAPGIDQASLSGLVAFDKTSLVKVLDRLVDKGLITREKSPTDRRRHCLNVTAKGRDVTLKILPMLDRAEDRLLAPLSKTERRVLLDLLTRVVNVNNIYSRVPLDQDLYDALMAARSGPAPADPPKPRRPRSKAS